MLDLIKRAIGIGQAEDAGSDAGKPGLELLASVLLLEAAHSDYECSELELEHVVETVRALYEIPHEYVLELMELARAERNKAVDIQHFTRHANERMSREEKLTVLEAVWRIILADGDIDKYEEHYARRLANLLWLEHKDFIDARRRARDVTG